MTGGVWTAVARDRPLRADDKGVGLIALRIVDIVQGGEMGGGRKKLVAGGIRKWLKFHWLGRKQGTQYSVQRRANFVVNHC